MSRPSTIDTLPSDVRERLHAWLRDPGITQTEATARTNALLAELDMPERVSRSGVNRYSQRMEEVGKRLRESRQVAEMWIAKLGAQPQGQVGHLVNEIVRTMAFEVSMTIQEGEINADSLPGVTKVMKDLALTMQRLEKAASDNVKRDDEIRRQERERVADEVDEAAKSYNGLDRDFAAFLREQVLKGLG